VQTLVLVFWRLITRMQIGLVDVVFTLHPAAAASSDEDAVAALPSVRLSVSHLVARASDPASNAQRECAMLV
jgi:hypothetical protein